MPEIFVLRFLGNHHWAAIVVRIAFAGLIAFGATAGVVIMATDVQFSGRWSQLDVLGRARILAMWMEMTVTVSVAVVLMGVAGRIWQREQEVLDALRGGRFYRPGHHDSPARSTVRLTPEGGIEAAE